MTEDALKHAIDLIKMGDVDQGEKILVRLLKEDQKLERAWAWLYACVKTDAQRIYCLKKVIELNPNHDKAKAALEKMLGRKASQGLPGPGSKQDDNNESSACSRDRETRADVKEDSLQISTTVKLENPNCAQPNKVKVVFIKPKIIFNEPNENLYAFPKRKLTDFPEVDSGMYGARLMLGGIYISSYDYPRCVDVGRVPPKSLCHVCEFFSLSDCPVRRDPAILREAKTLFSQRKRFWQDNQGRREFVLEAIYGELKIHGRPLHYEVLAKIVRDRYPRLKINPRKVVLMMSWHPEKFERVDAGVYRAR